MSRGELGGGELGELRFRRPVEADHAAVVSVVDEWWGGRRVHAVLPRLWFRHFTELSWIAETDDGRLQGFLVGFVGPDRPDEGGGGRGPDEGDAGSTGRSKELVRS